MAATRTAKAPTMTPKQRQVFNGLKAGKKPPEIAKRMKIGVTGVYGHIRRIRELGIELPDGAPQERARNGNGAAAHRNGHVKDRDVEKAVSSIESALAHKDEERARTAQRIEELSGELEHARGAMETVDGAAVALREARDRLLATAA